MKTHTPGPWAVYPPNFNADLCWSVQTDGGMSVIVCGGDTAENNANARLIAAAPELLAALSQLIDAATAAYDGQMGEFPDLVRATEKACGALAKAEGGEK